MTVVAVVALVMLGIAAALCVWRILREGKLPDRAMGIDTIVACMIGALACAAVATGDGLAADLAIVAGLLAFLGTLTIARFVEERGP